MYSEPRIGGKFMAGNMSSHSSIVIMFYVKQMYLEFVYDSVPSKNYIFDIVNVYINIINQTFAFTIPKWYGYIGYFVMIHCSSCPGYSGTVLTGIRSVA